MTSALGLPAPPPSVLVVMVEAEDRTRLRRFVAQGTLLVFIGAMACGALFVTLAYPEAPLARLWLWIFAWGGLLAVLANLALQLLLRGHPARRVRATYRSFLGALEATGRSAVHNSCINVLETMLRDRSEGHRDIVPFAAAFDELIMILTQIVTVGHGVAAGATRAADGETDLETCIIDIERLRMHIESDLLPDDATSKTARTELELRLRQAEVRAAVTERLLLLESLLVAGLEGLALRLRRMVGQGAVVMRQGQVEFNTWWGEVRTALRHDFRRLMDDITIG